MQAREQLPLLHDQVEVQPPEVQMWNEGKQAHSTSVLHPRDAVGMQMPAVTPVG